MTTLVRNKDTPAKSGMNPGGFASHTRPEAGDLTLGPSPETLTEWSERHGVNPFTNEERLAILRTANTRGLTVNGDPVRVTAFRRDFALLQRSDGFEAEYAWQTVARAAAGGADLRT